MISDVIPLGWNYLPVAFVLGALHALEPGHGKSMASAYLVSGEHSKKDAVVLGIATTFSHTFVVMLLALASLGLSRFVSQAGLERGISMTGAILLIGLGGWVCVRSIRDIRHGHSHGHDHSHGHGHDHQEHRNGGLWSVAMIGFSAGALPCPGALAALLVAVSLGQWALGLATVVTYSVGLATALAIMGIVVVEAGRLARSWLPSDRVILWLPLVSGLLVTGTGLWLLAARS